MAKFDSKHLYVLDIIRVMIVFLIFLFHISIHLAFNVGIEIVDRFINQSAVFMTSFFMLSGFLLYYLGGQDRFEDWNILKVFYKRRILKIYPLYFIFVVVFYLLLCRSDKVTPWLWGMQIIPLQAFFPQTFNLWINGGVWFVSVVFFLYACFPFLALILRQVKLNPLYLMLICYAISTYFNIMQAYNPMPRTYLYVSPNVRLLEFFIGMAVAKLYLEKQSLKFEYATYVILFLSLLLVILIGKSAHSTFINNVQLRSSYLNYNVFFIPVFALMILAGCFSREGILYNLSKSKIVQYLSKISYAFFLTQCFVIYGMRSYWREALDENWQKFGIVLLCNLIAAVAAYELVQKPIARFFSKKKLKS